MLSIRCCLQAPLTFGNDDPKAMFLIDFNVLENKSIFISINHRVSCVVYIFCVNAHRNVKTDKCLTHSNICKF